MKVETRSTLAIIIVSAILIVMSGAGGYYAGFAVANPYGPEEQHILVDRIIDAMNTMPSEEQRSMALMFSHIAHDERLLGHINTWLTKALPAYTLWEEELQNTVAGISDPYQRALAVEQNEDLADLFDYYTQVKDELVNNLRNDF